MSFGNCGYASPPSSAPSWRRPTGQPSPMSATALGHQLQRVQTCVRENIPVTAVVFNNGQWGAEKKNHVDFYSRRYLGVGLDNQPHWANVAVAMGAEGLRIDELSDVGPALREACEAQKRSKTTILEVMVTKGAGRPVPP